MIGFVAMRLKSALKKVLNSYGYSLLRTPSLSDFIRSRKVTLILDVGANVGQYCDFVRSEGYEGEIISFEPLKSAYKALCANRTSDRRWKAVNVALGSACSTAAINVSENTVFSSLRSQSAYATKFDPFARVVRTEEIEIFPLDHFADEINHHKNIFCKIDTQGFEEEVLKGAKGAIDRFCGIQLELPLARLYEQTWSFSAATKHLEELGFVPAQFRPTNCMTDDPASWTEVDCIFRRA